MRYLRVSRVIITILALLSATTNAAEISAAQAYQEINSIGGLNTGGTTPVTVKDLFEFSRLDKPGSTIEFNKVVFAGGVDAQAYQATQSVIFRESDLSHFNATGATWEKDLVFMRSVMRAALFKINVFKGNFVSENSKFEHLVDFTRARFHGVAHLLGGMVNKAWFNGTEFLGLAAFDGLEIRKEARFSSINFESDASFVETRTEGAIYFNRVNFKENAEFRRCEFNRLSFGEGKSDRIVFKGLADFRGCLIEKLIINQTDFYDDVNFFGAKLGAGGLSFTNVFMVGKNSYFEDVALDGPLVIKASYLPNLHFKWKEISDALLLGKPDITLLNALQARARELDRIDDASSLEYLIAKKKRLELLDSVDSPVLKKWQANIEYVLWGVPTGYGTKLGRITIIAACFWILGSLPLLVLKDALYRVPAAIDDSSSQPRAFRFRPLIRDALPNTARQSESFFERVLVTLGFTFSLILKLPVNVRYVENRFKPIGMHPLERYLAILWVIGGYLLVLIGITLAKTSPIISKIVGELI